MHFGWTIGEFLGSLCGRWSACHGTPKSGKAKKGKDCLQSLPLYLIGRELMISGTIFANVNEKEICINDILNMH